jgi:hypothetical protein
MKPETLLYATRIGQPSWTEELITNRAEQIADATAWAKANGFDRLRIATFDGVTVPNFAATIN